jgi:microsomal dipeptidase-like Zn-dependent dipeptidase
MIAPDLVADRLPAPQLGVDYVAIGTDMDGILPPSIIFDDYAEWPTIPAPLLARGVRANELGKVLGGNFAESLRR